MIGLDYFNKRKLEKITIDVDNNEIRQKFYFMKKGLVYIFSGGIGLFIIWDCIIFELKVGNLVGLLGLIVYTGICYLLSSHPKSINYQVSVWLNIEY